MKIEDLEKALKENIDVIFVKPATTAENLSRLFSLLIDHPHFQEKISFIRKELGIPSKGFENGQEAYDWEHANIARWHTLRKRAEALMGEFEINAVYNKDARFFTENYTLFPGRISHQLVLEFDGGERKERIKKGEKKNAARLIRTERDIEKNKYLVLPENLYLEINRNTTFRALVDAWKSVMKRKKERLPFVVSKPGTIARKVWVLSQQKVADKEIAKIIKSEIGRYFGYNDVPVYRKKYRDALEKLKPIERE